MTGDVGIPPRTDGKAKEFLGLGTSVLHWTRSPPPPQRNLQRDSSTGDAVVATGHGWNRNGFGPAICAARGHLGMGGPSESCPPCPLADGISSEIMGYLTAVTRTLRQGQGLGR